MKMIYSTVIRNSRYLFSEGGFRGGTQVHLLVHCGTAAGLGHGIKCQKLVSNCILQAVGLNYKFIDLLI